MIVIVHAFDAVQLLIMLEMHKENKMAVHRFQLLLYRK